jgi:hypothetical protein
MILPENRASKPPTVKKKSVDTKGGSIVRGDVNKIQSFHSKDMMP